jgi:hypothetical protein
VGSSRLLKTMNSSGRDQKGLDRSFISLFTTYSFFSTCRRFSTGSVVSDLLSFASVEIQLLRFYYPNVTLFYCCQPQYLAFRDYFLSQHQKLFRFFTRALNIRILFIQSWSFLPQIQIRIFTVYACDLIISLAPSVSTTHNISTAITKQCSPSLDIPIV